MIWSRRTFLRFVTVGAAITTAGVVAPFVGQLQASTLDWRALVYFLRVATDAGDGVWEWSLTRPNGAVLLRCVLSSGGEYTWYAAPGREIAVADGLVNASSVNVRIDELRVIVGGFAYVWTPTRGMVAVSAAAPQCPHVPIIWTPSEVGAMT